MVSGQKDTIQVWGIPFTNITLQQSVDWIGELIELRQPEHLITANLNYCMLADGDATLRPVTQSAIGILADGMPIVLRSRFSRNPAQRLPERVAGSELIYRLAQRAAEKGWRIYFLGAAPGVAQRCAETLQGLYPGMQIAGVDSPPFRQLTQVEETEMEQRIRDSKADILLVAFGQPKGEKWIAERYKRLGIPVSIQLGASFDFVAETAKRAPKLWQKTGFEWAYRMLSDPKRLAPRYAGNLLFLTRAIAAETAAAFSALLPTLTMRSARRATSRRAT